MYPNFKKKLEEKNKVLWTEASIHPNKPVKSL